MRHGYQVIKIVIQIWYRVGSNVKFLMSAQVKKA